MTARQLIRDVREQLVKACNCDEVREDPLNSEVCGHCLLVGIIDEGPERIGKSERLGPRRDDPPSASSRAVAGGLERFRELSEGK